MRIRNVSSYLLSLLLLGAAVPASAGLFDVAVTGDELTAGISLGGLDGELAVRFEDSTNLSTTSLGASVDLLDTTELLDVASRLPSTSVAVPSAYPVRLTIEPATTSGLSFDGVAEIEVYTNDLTYVLGSTLRLFAAPVNGDFVDITKSISGGSYRVRGSKGEFSEFVIANDLRSVDDVIDEKHDRLDNLLDEHEADIASGVFTTLVGWLDDVHTEYVAGDEEEAIAALDDFVATVESNRGTNIPETWRAARDLENVAGKLIAAAETLRFSLEIKAGS